MIRPNGRLFFSSRNSRLLTLTTGERSFFEVRFQPAFICLHLHSSSLYFHRGRIVCLATNCYGRHVLQKALNCEEDIRRSCSVSWISTPCTFGASNCRATRSSIITAALIDCGIVVDSARASDFHLVHSISTVFILKKDWIEQHVPR